MLKSANLVISLAEKKTARPRVFCKPWKISLEVAAGCNLRCITCGHHAATFGGIMSDAVFERIKPLLRHARTVNEVGYGEPFLDKSFTDRLKYVKQCGAAVYIYSNGTLLTRLLAEQLVALKLDQITFSVDGATKETFESIRLGADYAQVLDNIRGLHETKLRAGSRKPFLRANFVGMRRNIEELPQAIRTLAAVGIKEVVLSDLSPTSPELGRQCLAYFPDLAREVIRAAKRVAAECRVTFIAPAEFCEPPGDCPNFRVSENGTVPFDAGTVPPPGPEGRGARDERRALRIDPKHHDAENDSYAKCPCYEPWQTLYITHDGHVRPCCAMARSFGNVLSDDVAEIWNNRQYQLLRESVNSRQPAFSECRHCLSRRRVRIPLGSALALGARSVVNLGVARTARQAWKYLSEYR